MNLVGKILTALIALFSLVFMTFALAVYATHKNWREEVMKPDTGFQAQLKKEQDANKELKAQYDRLVAERDGERKASRDVAAALKTEADSLRTANAAQEKQLVDVRETERKALDTMKATQVTATSMRTELDQVRKDLADARKQREDTFKKMVALTDELHQTANELTTLKARNVTLVQDLGRYKDLALSLNITDPVGYLQKNPPEIGSAQVMTVGGGGLVEISVGSDQGLHKGHRLEVFRSGPSGPTYLGKVEVVETVPDRSVCKIIPEFQKGAIQKGDHVASKL